MSSNEAKKKPRSVWAQFFWWLLITASNASSRRHTIEKWIFIRKYQILYVCRLVVTFTMAVVRTFINHSDRWEIWQWKRIRRGRGVLWLSRLEDSTLSVELVQPSSRHWCHYEMPVKMTHGVRVYLADLPGRKCRCIPLRGRSLRWLFSTLEKNSIVERSIIDNTWILGRY